MKRILDNVLRLSQFMNVIAGVMLTLMMLLTVSDVVLRYLGRPIRGTYELVALAGAVAIGFAIPITSWMKGHIYVDFLVNNLSKRGKISVLVATKIVGISFFLIAGIFLIANALSMRESGEVSPTLQLPFYPVAMGLGVCCFIECLVLFADILKIGGGTYE